MPEFTVHLTAHARADLDALPEEDRSALIRAVRTLRHSPFPRRGKIKRLKGFPFPLYRLRAGSQRVLYRIDGEVVTIMRVIARRDLERILRRLHG